MRYVYSCVWSIVVVPYHSFFFLVTEEIPFCWYPTILICLFIFHYHCFCISPLCTVMSTILALKSRLERTSPSFFFSFQIVQGIQEGTSAGGIRGFEEKEIN